MLDPFSTCEHAAVTTKTISSVCATCGIIWKSGTDSCCGRGGSWFGTCGRAGNAKFEHTWYGGIRACETQRRPKAAKGQHLSSGQQKRSEYANDTVMAITSKSAIVSANMFAFTSAHTSRPISATLPIIVSTNKSMNTPTITSTMVTTTPSSPASTGTSIIRREPQNSLNMVDCINFILILVCW